MKNKILYILFFFPFISLFAQDITDAVRFSREDMMGTARFSAMGGAFSSLGGDMSSLKLNPAGSSIFLNNQAAVTVNLNLRNNDVNFGELNTNRSSNETAFDLNQAGAVFVFTSNNEEATISKYAYGFSYDQIANYNDSYRAFGNVSQSIGDFFAANAQGLPLDLLEPLPGETVDELYTFLGETEGLSAQNALLGYQTFVIDPVNPDDFNNTDYISNVQGNDFRHDYFINERGYNGRFSFNTSLEIKKRLYLGLNLNAHYMEYQRNTSSLEDNNNPDSSIASVGFNNSLLTRSNAFSFQLGAIAKVTSQLRAALSYQSPTWYRVSEEVEQSIESLRRENGGLTNYFFNPRILIIYPEYSFRTASTWRTGLSYVFGKRGLLSVDYSIQDYSNVKFRTGPAQIVNPEISQNLTNAASLNIGGEFVLKQFRFRGGYFTQESPYEDNSIAGDLTGYSFGLGYNLRNMNIDLAYTFASVERNDLLYNTGLSQTANVNNDQSNLFLTISFGF
jgi:hypothetical protein